MSFDLVSALGGTAHAGLGFRLIGFRVFRVQGLGSRVSLRVHVAK